MAAHPPDGSEPCIAFIQQKARRDVQRIVAVVKRTFSMNEGSLQSEDRMSSSRGVGSHSDPNPDDSEAAGLDESANQGSSNVSNIFDRRNGSIARVF